MRVCIELKYLLIILIFNFLIKFLFIIYFIRTNVDTERQILTILSPQPKPLPDACLILSDVQFVDR